MSVFRLMISQSTSFKRLIFMEKEQLDISAIVLTFNEELHIRRCLENAFRVAKDVFVIDCFSTDKTVEIAKEMGASVFQNKWTNYATQFNWGLDNAEEFFEQYESQLLKSKLI